MGINEAFDLCRLRWEDEVEYAETLRERRKLLTTVVVVAVSLGIFRVEMYADPSHVLVVTSEFARGLMKWMAILATMCMALGVFFLFKSGNKDHKRTKRASELLELSASEFSAQANQGSGSRVSRAWKTQKLRLATFKIAEGNRRISKNLRLAGILIGMAYAFLTVNALVYTLTRVSDVHHLAGSLNTGEGEADECTNDETTKHLSSKSFKEAEGSS